MRLSRVWLSGALALALAGCNSPTPAPVPAASKAASTPPTPAPAVTPAASSTAVAAPLSAPPVVLDKNQTNLPEGTQRALDETKAVEATLNQKYPKIQIDGMRRIRLGDTVVYEFRGSGVIGYTDEHVNYLMVGGDLISGVGDQAVNLTRQHLAEQAPALTAPANATSAPAPASTSSTSATATNPVTAPPVAEPSTASPDPSATAIVAGLPFERMLKFTYGKGERFLVVFTDPDCPYCQALEKQFTQMGDALNATVYVMPYPLTNLHPDADKKARYLWCTAHPDQSWREWMNNPADWTSFASIHPSTPNCPAAANVDVAVAMGKKLGFSATPTILFKNGMVWSGLASADELQKSFAYVVQHPNGIPTQPAPSVK